MALENDIETDDTLPWMNFQNEVFDAVKCEVDAYRTHINPRVAKVFQQKAYFSKDREKEIIFDVVVEAYDQGAKEPSLRWIWECKNYPSRKVSVSEIEEFSSKLEQIGKHNVIGTMVTRVGFEEGTYNIAVSQKISLYVLQKRLEKITPFAEKARAFERITIYCPSGLSSRGRRFLEDDGWSLDKFVQSELRYAGLFV